MHRQRFLLTALVATFTVSIGLMVPRHGAMAHGPAAVAVPGGQKGRPTPSPQNPVTSTINDDDSLGSALQLQSDDLNVNLTPIGQPYGIYQTDSATNVLSELDGVGECATWCTWDLFLQNSTSRSIKLTFNRLSGPGPTGTYSVHAHVHSHCFDPTGATLDPQNWFSITSSNPNCSMKVVFSLGKTNYVLVMSPLHDSPQPTGRAIVTCTRLGSDGSCSAWSVLPNLTQDNVINPNPTVANLYSVSRNGTFTFIGQYTLTYSANVTFP